MHVSLCVCVCPANLRGRSDPSPFLWPLFPTPQQQPPQQAGLCRSKGVQNQHTTAWLSILFSDEAIRNIRRRRLQCNVDNLIDSLSLNLNLPKRYHFTCSYPKTNEPEFFYISLWYPLAAVHLMQCWKASEVADEHQEPTFIILPRISRCIIQYGDTMRCCRFNDDGGPGQSRDTHDELELA